MSNNATYFYPNVFTGAYANPWQYAQYPAYGRPWMPFPQPMAYTQPVPSIGYPPSQAYPMAQQDQLLNQTSATSAASAAETFYDLTHNHPLLDKEKLKALLKQVHDNHLNEAFDQAVQQVYQTHGKTASGALDALKKKYFSNPITRHFKTALCNQFEDYLTTGNDTYRSTPMQYRAYGLYKSLADFVAMIRKHPIISIPVIAGVAWAGGKWKFLGAASGVAILACSAIGTIWDERKAHRIHGMNKEKSEALIHSGENVMAFALTALGYKEIFGSFKKGTIQIIDTFRTPTAAWANNPVTKSLAALWTAIAYKSPSRTNTKNILEALRMEWNQIRTFNTKALKQMRDDFLFVTGLFDNVLMPFNAAADAMERESV